MELCPKIELDGSGKLSIFATRDKTQNANKYNNYKAFHVSSYYLEMEQIKTLELLELEEAEIYILNIIEEVLIDIINMVDKSEDGFSCAITKSMIGTRKSFWFPVLFYESDIGWIRVRMELIKCLNCGWKGNGENPSLADLYDAVENKFEEMKIVQQLNFLKCPKCNSELKRDTIWLKGK